jgi:ABC-type multidrug transport system ATPase subunit
MVETVGTEPVVHVRGLTKRYGDVQAVAGIDFDVARG